MALLLTAKPVIIRLCFEFGIYETLLHIRVCLGAMGSNLDGHVDSRDHPEE
ncbi:hypothetical protein HPP92_002761 [Vanilla planifolia]|uniref:Uncharacterized protein n=1 Tax=Vanilla planifolia TaxID=51239 RepID=A0A835VIB2_VANPL|nr:hypothetical protein HPP92_002761 [Vanilla planifolia]